MSGVSTDLCGLFCCGTELEATNFSFYLLQRLKRYLSAASKLDWIGSHLERKKEASDYAWDAQFKAV
jgi:hypothetical protein